MRKSLIAVAVVLALAALADVVARNVAESRLADHIDEHQSVTGTEVDIHGFSFLLQAARSEFGEVDVTLPTIQASASGSPVLQVDDVRLKLSDLHTSQMFTEAVADRVQGSGTVSYEQLTAILGVDVSYDEETGGLLLAAPRLNVGVRVEPSVDDDGNLTLGAAQLPPSLRQIASTAFGFSGIPDDLEVSAVRPTRDGLRITLLARNVAFAR